MDDENSEKFVKIIKILNLGFSLIADHLHPRQQHTRRNHPPLPVIELNSPVPLVHRLDRNNILPNEVLLRRLSIVDLHHQKGQLRHQELELR